MEPLAVGSARIVVGAALLAVVALLAARSAERAAEPACGKRPLLGGARALVGTGDRRLILLAGVFVAAYQASFFAAVADTGVAVGTVVALGSAPAFTGLSAARSRASASSGAGSPRPASRVWASVF